VRSVSHARAIPGRKALGGKLKLVEGWARAGYQAAVGPLDALDFDASVLGLRVALSDIERRPLVSRMTRRSISVPLHPLRARASRANALQKHHAAARGGRSKHRRWPGAMQSADKPRAR
jgi:hypothetical protein